MSKTPGQLAYEEDCRREPRYGFGKGRLRDPWEKLSHFARATWEDNPTPRAASLRTQLSQSVERDALTAAVDAARARGKFLTTLHCDLADEFDRASNSLIVERLSAMEIDVLNMAEFNRLVQRAVSALLEDLVSASDDRTTLAETALGEFEERLESQTEQAA